MHWGKKVPDVSTVCCGVNGDPKVVRNKIMKLKHPLYANHRTAAALLDLSLSEFDKLVKAGHLPGPIEIGKKVERWDVHRLQDIISGSTALGEDLEW